jgi:hypothetical protein
MLEDIDDAEVNTIETRIGQKRGSLFAFDACLFDVELYVCCKYAFINIYILKDYFQIFSEV